MREFRSFILNKIYDFLEEILYLIAFIVFNTAMFKISLICGLVTLSIILFIIASFVTFIKINKVNKRRC